MAKEIQNLPSKIDIPYQARVPFQAFHQRPQSRAVMVCHRRAGKTTACIFDLIIKSINTKKPNARFVYIAPYKNQTKNIVWEELLRGIRSFGNMVKINNQELTVTFKHNNASIKLYGADDPDSLRGIYCDGAILDEYAQMRPSLYSEVLVPALSDRMGWVVFIGTPKGHDEFYRRREMAKNNPEEYFYLELKASETGFVPEERLAIDRTEMSESEYQQEYECSFEASLKGSFYADQINELQANGHVLNIPYNKSFPVNTAWDLGLTDKTAIWFYQIVENRLHIIDYYETSRTPLPEIVSHLLSKEYRYGVHHLPHDACHERLGMDKTIIEQLWRYGLDVRSVPKLSIRSGIASVRKILNKSWFDANRCFIGLEALKMYQKTYNKQSAMYIDHPKHDKYSDAADAFRMLALAVRDSLLEDKTVKPETVSVMIKGELVTEPVTTTKEKALAEIELKTGVKLVSMPKISMNRRRQIRY